MLSTLGTQIFLLRLFYLLKEQKRVLDQPIFSRIDKTTEKLRWTQNDIVDINALILFIYLSKSKLMLLLMGSKIINYFFALEHFKNVFRNLQASTMELLAKLTSNVNSKSLMFIPKPTTLYTWYGQNVPLQIHATQFLKFKQISGPKKMMKIPLPKITRIKFLNYKIKIYKLRLGSISHFPFKPVDKPPFYGQ